MQAIARMSILVSIVSASAFGQYSDWQIHTTDAGMIRDASLLGLDGDSLVVSSPAFSGKLGVNSIQRLQRADSHLMEGVVAGVMIGGAAGFFIGSKEDESGLNNSTPTGSPWDKKLKSAFIGGVAGGAIGVLLGTLTGSDIYRLEQKNAGEKTSLLQMILHREGDVPDHPPVVQQQRDVMYLKDSRVIRGTVVELIPDSTVRIMTADSTLFVFRMSEVERMAKEMPTRVAAPSAPPSQRDQPSTRRNTPARSLSLTLHGGLGFPLGEFAETSGPTAGIAKTGFMLGADLDCMLGDFASWVTSVDFAFHATNQAALTIPTGYSGDIGSWLMIWPMTGFRLSVKGSDEVKPYAQAQVGILAGSSPPVTLTSESQSVSQSSVSGTSVAFGAGAGLYIGRQFSVGARYFHGEPEYEISAVSSSGAGIKGKYTQPTSIIVLMLGITF